MTQVIMLSLCLFVFVKNSNQMYLYVSVKMIEWN